MILYSFFIAFNESKRYFKFKDEKNTSKSKYINCVISFLADLILFLLLSFIPKHLSLSSTKKTGEVNEKKMQSGNTKNMIFNTNFILSYLSKFMSLQPGDLVTTGTPAGVGMGMNPQVFLKTGDNIKISIDNLGTQNSKIVSK